MAGIDDAIAAVTAENTVIDSAIELLNQLSTMLKAAGTDPVKIQSVIDSVNSKKQALAQAIVNNTPAATQ